MKKLTLAVSIVVVVVLLCVSISSDAREAKAKPSHHVMLTADTIKWGPFPALGPGVELAILSGDPDKVGSPFVLRIKQPDGHRIPPHWHPVDEHVTVISGTFLFGTGEKFDEAALHELPPGSYAFMPKKTRHFALAKGETITQASGVGPFKVIYVNPADDPARKAGTGAAH